MILMSSRGPHARGERGAGSLSIEENDPTADRMAHVTTLSGGTDCDVALWNAYRWYSQELLGGGLTHELLPAVVEPLGGALRVLPAVRVIVSRRGEAQSVAQLFLDAEEWEDLTVGRRMRMWRFTQATGPGACRRRTQID